MEHTCNACLFQSPSGGFCRRYGRFICDLQHANEECNEFTTRHSTLSREWLERKLNEGDTEL